MKKPSTGFRKKRWVIENAMHDVVPCSFENSAVAQAPMYHIIVEVTVRDSGTRGFG
jgi:hypothetical protein